MVTSVGSAVSSRERIEFFHQIFFSGRLSSLSGAELLALATKFDKVEPLFREAYRGDFVEKKVAVLASFTTHHLLGALKLFFYEQGIAPEFYEGEYNGIAMELMNPDSPFFHFNSHILLILPYHTDIGDYPSLFAEPAAIDAWLREKQNYYQSLWSQAQKLDGCQILQALFVSPLGRQLGHLEANYSFSRSTCLKMLNLELIKKRPHHVRLLDLDYIASELGKKVWFDEPAYFISKQPFSFEAFAPVCRTIARCVGAQCGKLRKCLVLDLDNTLWGGVVGDDGLHGIELNPNHAVGEAFLAFQKYVRLLKERGVLVAVCSKNDEATAKQVFLEHSDMILKLDDIACFIANWDDKASNLKRVAETLNIGLDTLVFVDDNPAERDIVRRFLPMVQVIELPDDPALFIRAIEKAQCFEWAELSREDVSRPHTYITERKRSELQASMVDYDSYLQSLEMSALAGHAGALELPRFTQLVNKSNQFNLRTHRYTERSIEQMVSNPQEWSLVYVDFKDRFDHYGIISSAILQKRDQCVFIDTWVMSCRVLGREVERFMFNHLCRQAKTMGRRWLVGEYIPTLRNKLVSQLLPSFGFEPVADGWFPITEPGSLVYRFDLDQFSEQTHFIRSGY